MNRVFYQSLLTRFSAMLGIDLKRALLRYELLYFTKFRFVMFLVGAIFIIWWFFPRSAPPQPIDESEMDDLMEDVYFDRILLNKAKRLTSQVKVTDRHATININTQSFDIYYKEAKLPETTVKGFIILLHDMAKDDEGTSDAWSEGDNIKIFAAAGYHVIAPDLPGTRGSRTTGDRTAEEKKASKDSFLKTFISNRQINKTIIFCASSSTTFAIPLLIQYPELFQAFVAVSPVGAGLIFSQEYEKIKVPTLIIYGQQDEEFGKLSYQKLKNIPNSKRVIIPGIKSRIFQETPDHFNAACLQYLDDVLH